MLSPPVSLLLTTSSEISYTLTEFRKEFKNEDQELQDFRNVFNAQMQAVAKKKKKLYEYHRKRIRTLSPHSHTQITLASKCYPAIGGDKKRRLPRIVKGWRRMLHMLSSCQDSSNGTHFISFSW